MKVSKNLVGSFLEWLKGAGEIKIDITILIFLIVTSFYSSLSSTNKYSDSDSLGCLLTSQAIIDNGTIKLDAYEEYISRFRETYSYRVIQINKSLYYAFPLGACIYSVPFVWLANLWGWDMKAIRLDVPIDDIRFQSYLAALSVAACAVLIYLINRSFLKPSTSVFITIAFLFGTSLISTLGTALWSFNYEVLFILLSILILIYDYQERIKANSLFLGLFSFSAYFCRPTAAIFIIPFVAYLIHSRNYEVLFKTGFVMASLFISFILYSKSEFGLPLPPYYLPARLEVSGQFWIAIYGNLVSPSRGLFVFSSFLFPVVIGAIASFKKLSKSLLFWLPVSWIALHLIAISTFPHWWGGHSFGPRLQTDILPAYLLLSIIVYRKVFEEFSPLPRRTIYAFITGLVLISVYINVQQGLFNPATTEWNSSPDIDLHQEYLFDWDYPQFLASEAMLELRTEESLGK